MAASLFKLWLRELEEPVIPTELYNDALKCSQSAEDCIEFIARLPIYNRRVLLFVVSFFQQFMREEVLEVTKMTAQNLGKSPKINIRSILELILRKLALILAPNILRTTSDDLETVFTNSSFESRFMLQLLENLKPREMDPEYIPTHGPAMEHGRTDRGYHREI